MRNAKSAKHVISGLLSALLISVGLYGSAQAADISDCRAIQDRLARYACYDSWDAAAGTVSRDSRQQSAPEQAGDEAGAENPSLFGRIFNRDTEDAQPEAPPQTAAEPAVDGFGKSNESSSARVQEGSNGRTELIDTVASLEQRGPGMWRITLESGQQWQQMFTKNYFLKVGDEVRIYPTRWGSAYRLTAARLAGYIQVERVD